MNGDWTRVPQRLVRAAVAVAAALVSAACGPDISGLYVANGYSNSITVYALGATGNVAPVRTIIGPSTGLFGPYGIVLDGIGNLYVANLANNSITVYPPGADANVAPIHTISGASTGLHWPLGVALDGAGNLYVANAVPTSITVYPPGADGNVAPTHTINGGTWLFSPVGVTYFAGNSSLYVSDGNVLGGNGITAWSTNVWGVGPSSIIMGPSTKLNAPTGVALDSASNLYVANLANNSITVYPWGKYNNVAPARTISGASTGLSEPYGILLDGASNLYVVNSGNNSITVYPPSAEGNVAPVRTISGANTGLSSPHFMFLRP